MMTTMMISGCADILDLGFEVQAYECDPHYCWWFI